MAKKGAEFELFVKAIYEEILEQDEIENVRVEHDVKIGETLARLKPRN